MSGHDDTTPHDVEPLDPTLAAALEALPRAIEPGRDLWGAIDQALVAEDVPEALPETPRSAARWPVLLFAAAAVLAALGAGAGLLSRIPDPGDLPETAAAPAAPTKDTARPTEAWATDLQRANQALLSQLSARDDLSPEARASIDENLARIDAAIAEVQRLLDERPDDPELKRWLTDTEALKQRVLVSALHLPEGS